VEFAVSQTATVHSLENISIREKNDMWLIVAVSPSLDREGGLLGYNLNSDNISPVVAAYIGCVPRRGEFTSFVIYTIFLKC
jgi:hypothetical protein